MEVFYISQAAIQILKRLLVQFALDEERRNNIFIILISILCIVLVLLLALVSFPAILISSLFGSTSETNFNLADDTSKIAVYQDAIFSIDRINEKWIEDMKEEYSYCDEFNIEYNYDLTWQELISIDSVLLNQDFTKMDNEEIIQNGLKFITKDTSVIEKEVEEKYEVEEEYQVEEEVIDPETGEKIIKLVTKTRMVTRTRTVIKEIANIKINTKDFKAVLGDVNIVSEEDIFIATNILNTISSMDVEGNLNIYDEINLEDLKEYPEGYANLPYYNQTDKRWGAISYGNSTIMSGGCGPTSLAMVVAGLTENKVTPDIVASWSYRNGHRAEGQGSYWSLMAEGGSYYGLEVESVNRRGFNQIRQALSDGYPVIASMGRGHFTRGGHFIVLRGITKDGKILVHDSASVERSNKEWDLSIIMNESSTNGGVNGSPFWIFKP